MPKSSLATRVISSAGFYGNQGDLLRAYTS